VNTQIHYTYIYVGVTCTYLVLCCHCMGEVSGTIVLYRQVLSMLVSEAAVDTDWPLAIRLL